jgi:RND superfamily putative drug exporter
MQSMAPPGGESELVGIAVALVVLVLTFGALVSAGVPIVTAVWGVALGLTGVTAMIAFTDDCEEAVGVAVGTGGSAVVFAGLTVLIALSALAVVQMPFLTAMGLAPRRPC